MRKVFFGANEIFSCCISARVLDTATSISFCTKFEIFKIIRCLQLIFSFNVNQWQHDFLYRCFNWHESWLLWIFVYNLDILYFCWEKNRITDFHAFRTFVHESFCNCFVHQAHIQYEHWNWNECSNKIIVSKSHTYKRAYKMYAQF